MSGAPYGWIIVKDYTEDDQELDDSGLTGPRFIDPEIGARLTRGEGRKFRMYDDDGELYYEGRIITNDDGGSEIDFCPLDDFGMPNSGCTRIDYLGSDGKTWETL